MTASHEYQEHIEQLILRSGPQGINALAKELNVPVSNLQRYMERQRYFVKNDQRKWDIPANAAQLEVAKAQGNLDSIIESQLTGIESMFDLLSANIRSTITLMKTHKPSLPVAEVSNERVISAIHDKLWTIVEATTIAIPKLIKENKKNLTPEQFELLSNIDWLYFVLKRGSDYVNDKIFTQVYSLLVGEISELPESEIEEIRKWIKKP